MNFVIPANPVQISIYSDRSATRPITPVAEQSGQFRDATRQQPSTYVYRGEVLEAVVGERSYRPASNLQIHPQYQRAIDTYHAVSSAPAVRGRILDGFI